MTVVFSGGPLDGKTREIPDDRAHQPFEVPVMDKMIDPYTQWTEPSTYRIVRYVNSGLTSADGATMFFCKKG